ncbi:MAG: helix-turn-helix transcriptional regulator [Pyrinomonadaceae bacterium]
MGRKPRPKPKRLADKLLTIRTALGLSQSEMLKRLAVDDVVSYHRISEYETDKRDPPWMILLSYARVAGVHLEDIVDDELDLPNKLPGNVRYVGIKHKPTARSKKR